MARSEGWGLNRASTWVSLLVSGVLAAAACVVPGSADAVTTGYSADVPSHAADSVAARVDKKKRPYRTPTGPFFNNPHGDPASRYRIERQVVHAIDATQRKETIRIALYSFDRMGVARALLAARARGVHVQLLLNDHQDTRAMKVLRHRLGTDRSKPNFIYKCHSSCRGQRHHRHLHTKFYTFTRAGKSRNVVMVGSANVTLNAVKHQWNDLYLMSGDKPLFDQFIALFNDMKHDYGSPQPSYEFCGTPVGARCDDAVDKYTAIVFPRPVGRHNDVVLDILNRIRCVTPKAGGGKRRTQLVLSMHTIRGHRGNYIAAAIRRKFAEGCNFRVQFGLIGYHTKRILGAPTRRGRIPLRSTGYDFNKDEEVDRYTHQKYFVIRGNYAGNPNTNLTFTGSSNWSSLGNDNDEIQFSIRGKAVARKYVNNFDFMWRPGNSRNAYTTTYMNFRSVGSLGPAWEND
jgi:phosphatidylserine/phosphatidylglycerophosphate/cardiolipin synthase-like enzyme